MKESSLVSSSKIAFYDHWSYLHNMYAERKTDIDECEVEFSKVLWFNFGVGGRNNSCWHTAKLKKYGLGILMTP